MVAVEACQLSLSNLSLSTRHPNIVSLLFDPISRSLALRHSDSSFSLYASVTLFSVSSLPGPSTFVPPPVSSAVFLHIRPARDQNRDQDSIFISSSPVLGGTAVLLRFYLFNPITKAYGKLKAASNHRDLRFDARNSGLVFGVTHGAAVKLAGGTNFFAMHSVTNSKIWVFGVKMVADSHEVKLMKCAVIDCIFPVFAMNLSFGHLILGEENGVRVFQLRPLVKGRVGKDRRLNGSKNLKGHLKKNKANLEGKKVQKLQKGLIKGIDGISLEAYSGHIAGTNLDPGRESNLASNGLSEGKSDKRSDPVKANTTKLRQDTKEYGACYLAFNVAERNSSKSTETPRHSAKAISIQALCPNKFLILDSTGDLYLLAPSNSKNGSESRPKMEKLTKTMKAQKLAAFSGTQSFWVSDGQYTVHMLNITDSETETHGDESKEPITQLSVVLAIFCGEKILEMVPISSDAMLILGQGCLYAYAIS